jgi:hypothetical protein
MAEAMLSPIYLCMCEKLRVVEALLDLVGHVPVEKGLNHDH